MRSWRNWQTRKTKDLVSNIMEVQVLLTAPKKNLLWFFFYLSRNACYQALFANANGLEPVGSAFYNQKSNSHFFSFFPVLIISPRVRPIVSPVVRYKQPFRLFPLRSNPLDRTKKEPFMVLFLFVKKCLLSGIIC